MKTLRRAAGGCLWSALLLLSATRGLAADVHEPRRGKVERLRMPAPALGKASRPVRVYLPPSYFRPEAAQRRYPVVYLLHGSPGSEGNWLSLGRADETADSLIAARRIPEIIMVFPNGTGIGMFGLSLYMNSYDGKQRMEDFIVQDLVGWVDEHYRTRREPGARALIGLSEGATGAMNLTFRHPGVFGACGGHSGAYRLTRAWGDRRIVGREPGASRLLAEYSPMLYVQSIARWLEGVAIYFDVGTTDDVLRDNQAFHRKLQTLGIAHVYNEFPGGHSWTYWRAHLREALIAVTARMR